MIVEPENLSKLTKAIKQPACLVTSDLSIICTSDTFYEFTGVGKDIILEQVLLCDCITIDHPWHEDMIISKPRDYGRPGYIQNISILNSVNFSLSVSIQSIPFINDNDMVQAILLLFNEKDCFGLYSDQILELIEQQEIKLRAMETIDGGVVLTNTQLKTLVQKQSKQLIEITKTLRTVKEEINDELEMAKNVQTSLMPKELPDLLNLNIASIYIPAGKVGGDFYDIIKTQTQKIAILIYDVSGHGVPAALIGATAKMLFAHYIDILDSPAKIFEEVNKNLCSFLQTEHYLTAFLGILDPIQNIMIYSRAGHVKPYVYKTNDKKIIQLSARGFFIGHPALIDIAEYTEDTITLTPGDKMLFYTDGLTEGSNYQQELYGNERLFKSIERFGHCEVDTFLNHILEDQKQFRRGNELQDDFTMLCVEIGDSGYMLKDSGFTKEDKPQMYIIHKKEEIEKLSSIILKAMDNYGFSDMEIKRTKICIFETTINGIDHGNNDDPEKKLVVLFKIEKDKAVISIVDDGKGFDYNNLPNPLDDENIMKECGRGIYIVQQYMDEVVFNEKGNRILMTKYPLEEK